MCMCQFDSYQKSFKGGDLITREDSDIGRGQEVQIVLVDLKGIF